MSKVAIVTDSTSTIPDELLTGLPISTAPMQVIWSGQTYLDGIDIKPGEFYKRLRSDPETPTTSQATPGAFMSIYAKLLEEGYEILSLHISAKLSGTLDSAYQAREHFPGAKIEIVDSNFTAMALGFQVLAAARAAQQGATLRECVSLAEKSRQHVGVYFLVDTLEYLRRGGRIGGAAALLGTVINLKPILELRDGRVEPVQKVRTMTKAVDRLLDMFEAKASQNCCPIRISALHADDEQEAQELLVRARQRFGISDVHDAVISVVSPAIGVHSGPGALGLAYMSGM